MCYNTADAVPVSHGKCILKIKFEFVFTQKEADQHAVL